MLHRPHRRAHCFFRLGDARPTLIRHVKPIPYEASSLGWAFVALFSGPLLSIAQQQGRLATRAHCYASKRPMNENPIRFDIQQVLRLLPHRYPCLLIDRVLALEPRAAVTALKNVTVNEPYFVGHYPGSPVMPGVLCIEALLQTAAILVAVEGDADVESKLHRSIEIERVRFRRSVYPGDQLLLHVELEQDRDGAMRFKSTATVDGAIAVEATISSRWGGPGTAPNPTGRAQSGA